MYFVGLIILVGLIYFYMRSRKTSPVVKPRAIETGGAQRFLPPIPAGYQIYAGSMNVAGLQHRKVEGLAFARSSNQSLALEREPNNAFDPNAIKLIGVAGSQRFFIGYVPKELSAQIVQTALFDQVQPRLARIYIGRYDFLEIEYQIIGPKTEKAKFDQYLQDQPALPSQKEYFKFFGLPVSKGLTAGQAGQTISDHRKTSEPRAIEEWEGYSTILDEFDDKDFREGYDLKKVGRTVLLEALDILKAEGKTYSYLSDNIDEVVEKVIELKPDLEKQ